jgi:hypothetical protein
MMPASFEEHVCLEMALGEGFVLMALYAVIDTIDHPGIREILERAVRQEERHVDFGERRTREAIARRPRLRRPLLGLSLVSTWAVRRLARFMRKRLPAGHPVLSQLPAFVEFAVDRSELRLQRMGVAEVPPSRMPLAQKGAAVALAYGRSLATAPLRLFPRKRLTQTYLRDPSLRARIEAETSRDVTRPPAA